MSYVALDVMFFRWLCKISSRFGNPIFLRCLKGMLYKDAFKLSFTIALKTILLRCLKTVFYTTIWDVFRQLCKIPSRFANPTSFRPLKDILPRCLKCLHKTFISHLFLPTGLCLGIEAWDCFNYAKPHHRK